VCGATGAAAYLDWPWWLLDEEVPGLSPVRGQWRRQLLIASRDATGVTCWPGDLGDGGMKARGRLAFWTGWENLWDVDRGW
jgi:hypothetical protein